MSVGFDVRGQQEINIFTGWSIIMDLASLNILIYIYLYEGSRGLMVRELYS